MTVYHTLIRHLIRNYFIGSVFAVLGVGSVTIFMTLNISWDEARALSVVLLFSLLIMFGCEWIVFKRHLAPIRNYFQDENPSREDIQLAYFRSHMLPTLSVRRIMGPHLLGGYIPASIMLMLLIRADVLSLPYSYIGIAAIGALLVAGMHALIEFFLTNQSIRPVLTHMRKQYVTKYQSDLTLDGKVLVSIQRKFQWSAFLIGTFPLFLLSLVSQVRLGELSSAASQQFWKGAAVILLMGIFYSSVGAWLLSRDIVHPIRNLFLSQERVREGDLDIQAPDIYSDEFSKLITGFQHMVEGLRSKERMNAQLIQSYFSTLAAALDARDPYTAGHSLRVADYSLTIGREIGMSSSELDVLKRAALLHDIGKIGIRDTVLLKEGRLTEEEFESIKTHPVLGENILKQIEPAEAMSDILPGVRSHHEHFNGRGYPDGLSGYHIPMLGRIIAIADSFDAMTSDRPYRKGMPVEKALSILEEGKGIQWDPDLVDPFIRTIRHKQVTTLSRRSPIVSVVDTRAFGRDQA